jgi:hypothetical protein
MGNIDTDQLHEEAETLFELFAMSNDRAPELLEALDTDDPARVAAQIIRLRDLATAARALQGPPPPPPGQSKEVA